MIRDVRHFIPATPSVYRSSPTQFTVKWLMPEVWKFSEDFVLVVEHGSKSNWTQALREFSDADKDGYIRINIEAAKAGRFLRLHLTDVEYHLSKSSSTVDLKRVKRTGGAKSEPVSSKTVQASSVWIL